MNWEEKQRQYCVERKALGISRTQMAQELEISPSTLRNIELASQKAGDGTLEKINHYLTAATKEHPIIKKVVSEQDEFSARAQEQASRLPFDQETMTFLSKYIAQKNVQAKLAGIAEDFGITQADAVSILIRILDLTKKVP